MKFTSIVVFLGLYFLSLLLINNGFNTELCFSVFYVILSIFSAYIVWNNSGCKINIFYLHILTFNLFIGGRFYVYLFDDSLTPFLTTFFYDYRVGVERQIEIFTYVISFLAFSTVGHYLSIRYPVKRMLEPSISYQSKGRIDTLLQYLFPVLVITILYLSINNFKSIIEHGYGISAIAVDERVVTVSVVDKFAPMLLGIFLAMSVAYGKRKTTVKYFILYATKGVISILGGSRADFGIVILMTIWIYSMTNKVNAKKIVAFLSIGLCTLFILFSFSVRESEIKSDSFSLGGVINVFLYTNGGSLMIFDAARLVDNYPILPYFQSFITGASFFYSKLTGIILYPQDISFEGHLCNTLNPALFSEGKGLGWTTIADIYLFSGRSLFFYCFLSMVFGSIIGTIEHWSKQSAFFKYVSVALAPSLLMMARGGLFNFFPAFTYIYLFFLVVLCIVKRVKLKKY